MITPKPRRHRTEINPFGSLREGLQSAILFDVTGAIYDYVVPGRKFTVGYPFGVAYPGVGSFTDGSGNVWTIDLGNNGQVFENGALPNGQFTSNTIIVFIISTVIYIVNTSQQIYFWTGTAWTAYNGADPRIGQGMPAFADSDIGGSLTTGGGGYYMMATAALTPAAWTVSVMTYLTGTNLANATPYFRDGSGNDYFYVQGTTGATPGALSFNGGNAQVGSWLANAYSGWHRITVTASAQTGTGTFYFDGISQGTASINVGTTQLSGILGDTTAQAFFSYAIADLFCWNYALGASEVAEHNVSPYGTTLRSRFGKFGLGQVGNIPLNACRGSALMLLGVGQ